MILRDGSTRTSDVGGARMDEDRLVKKIYRIRKVELDKKNWCYHTRALLQKLGLGEKWTSEDIGVRQGEWIATVKKAVREREEEEWKKEVASKTKLRTYTKLKTKLESELYLEHDNPWARRMMTRIRGGTNRLRIETGRWEKLPREENM